MGLVPFKNEPLTDFSVEEKREEMRAAIEMVGTQLGKEYPLVVGGKPLEADEQLVSVNPAAPGEVVGRVAKAGEREADMALEAAYNSYQQWRKVAPDDRARIMLRAAGIMRRRKRELSAWVVYEVGKNWHEAEGDVSEAIDFLEYYAREMMRLKDGKEIISRPGEETRYFYQPLGVAVIISPWNFPIALLTGMTGAALVTGNAVVIKPSEYTPVTGAKVAEVMKEAGLPDGVLNFLPGYGSEIGDYLVSDPRTHLISFTGSVKTGLRINELAARQIENQRWIKRVIAEMGGKDAMVIDDSADLDAAAQDIIVSAYGFGGQKCSAASRIILHEDIYDEVLSRVVENAKRLKVGSPVTNPDVDMGPVQNEAQFEKVSGYLEVGKNEGEWLLGEDLGDPQNGYFVPPTLFADVDPKARIAQEEVFGPVLSAIKARSFDEALKIVNDNPYGLTGGVYTSNRKHMEIARQDFQAGMVYFNRTITAALVGVHPFGGFKLSGTDAKTGGPDYLPLHMEARTVVERF